MVVEQLLTDTARFADYVFPATSQLEHLDLLTSWGQDYLSLNQPAVPPRGEAVPNSEFFRRLSRRMGFSEPYLYESDEELVKTLLRSQHPYLGGVTYEQLRERGWVRLALPEPWLPFAKGGFPTPSGKCEFFSKGLEARGVDPLPGPRPPPRRRAPAAARPDLPAGPPDLEVDAALQQLEPRRRAAPAEGRGRASPPDPRRGRGSPEHPGRRPGAGLQRPRLGADAGAGRGRDAAGRRRRCPTASGRASSREAPPGTPSPRTA